MKFIVNHIDGIEVPLIFDESEIKTIEFFKDDRKVEADLPKGFPKNYPGHVQSYINKPVYKIVMTFKDGMDKEIIFELADRQLWVQALNKLSGIDFNKLRVKKDGTRV